MKISDNEISRSRASSVSSDDGARQEEGKSPIARELSGVESGGKKSGNTTWYVPLNPASRAKSSQPEKLAIAADLDTPSRANSLQNLSNPALGEEPSPIAQNIVSVSNPAEPVSVSDVPAMEPKDVAAETAVKEIAVEENAEDAGATAEPHAEPLGYTEYVFTDEELLAELENLSLDMPETNGIVVPESTSNGDVQTPWQRVVAREIADREETAEELADADEKFASLQLLDGILDGVDPLEPDASEEKVQAAARKRIAPNNPSADPATGASTGASGGPAAAAQPAPSSVVENSTCASQFGEKSLKILFAQGGQAKNKSLSALYEKSENAYAKLTVLDFAQTLNVSLHKIQDDAGLSKEEKKSLVTKLKSLAKKYISLIESEGLDKKSAFGAFYLGHKTERNQRLKLEGELVALSGGKNVEGRKTLQNLLIQHTVRPFIDARLTEMFGGKPSGYTTSLTAEMLDARAQEALDEIGKAAENYSTNHGASVRGLAFGFSLVTLWPELLRKILDDETPAAAQAQNPAATPAENGDPSQPFLPPPSAGGPPNPMPASSPEPAMPNENGSGAGGGTVINIGSININNSDNRSNYNNGGITFGHDGARAAMGPEDDGSDVSSESSLGALTKANLAAHDRLFSGGRIALPTISQTSESDSETSESDVDSEKGEDLHSIYGDFYASRDTALDDKFIAQENPVQPELSVDEIDSGIFKREIEDRSDKRESVARSLNGTSDGSASSASSDYGSDAEQSEVSRHRSSARSPLTPGSFTFQSGLLPSGQGASAIESVIIGRAVGNVINGWVQIEKDDGTKSWEQARKLTRAELTRNRDLERRLGGVKPGAPELPHPWARSEWQLSRKTGRKSIPAGEPVGQPDLSSLLFPEQDADGAYFQNKF